MWRWRQRCQGSLIDSRYNLECTHSSSSKLIWNESYLTWPSSKLELSIIMFKMVRFKMEIVFINLFRNETKKGVFRMRKNKCNDFTVLADENRPSSTGSYYTNNSTNTIVHDKTRWMSSFTEIRSLFWENMFHNLYKMRNNHFQKGKVSKLK